MFIPTFRKSSNPPSPPPKPIPVFSQIEFNLRQVMMFKTRKEMEFMQQNSNFEIIGVILERPRCKLWSFKKIVNNKQKFRLITLVF